MKTIRQNEPIGLLVYLLKKSVQEPRVALEARARDNLKTRPINAPGRDQWVLVTRDTQPKPPKWADFFAELVDPSFFGEVNGASALLFVPVADRLFAIAFGQGRSFLRMDSVEDRFGLKVVLNSVNEGRLRSIDRESFDAIPLQAREQASREATPFDFGLDIERDLLRAASGIPTNERIGTPLSGMDSLKTYVACDLNNLPELLERINETYNDNSYKRSFPWVDHIQAIRDRQTIISLDDELIRRLRAGDIETCWLAAPFLLDWTTVRGFRYGSRGPEYHDLHIKTFLNDIERSQRSIDKKLLLNRKVTCISDQDSEIERWSIYKCLYIEIDLNDDSYLLSRGKWYRIERNFAKEVNTYFEGLRSPECLLPPYNDKSEKKYLERISSLNSSIMLFDRKLISHGASRSTIEFCDLLTSSGDIIHVKRYGASSVLSHLFAQGLMSSELFLFDKDFRRKIGNILPSELYKLVPLTRPDPESYRVVFAIISQSTQPLRLPFFSRLSLRHAAQRLQRFGLRVALVKIGVEAGKSPALNGEAKAPIKPEMLTQSSDNAPNEGKTVPKKVTNKQAHEDMGMDELLARLRTFDALRDDPDEDGHADQVIIRSLSNSPPDPAPDSYLNQFPIFLRNALAAQGINRLYAHQAEAIDRIRAAEDVVLEAPTASGKTLCFNIPLVLALTEAPHDHALIIHPMKALSNDQRRQFENLAGALENEGGRRLESWIFDGDLSPEERRWTKKSPPAVLFTNPDMLHLSFLGQRDQWRVFLSALRLVIIDEIHEYRGYFGTNVGLLLRRFFAMLHQINVHPQVVLATATCGNAQEHAYRLTGRRCTHVRANTTMQAERHFAFIDPNIPNYRFLEIYRLRVAYAALACVAQGLNTLVFCPSRKFTEEAVIRARKEAEKLGIDPEEIALYRSGLGTDLRRQIEDGLRSGRYKAVFSTNALELGLDIGRLDACILAGFPDNMLSAWQRIGRVGRSWDKQAYIIFYAFNNPFDKFFAANIDIFLEKPLDEILIGVDNVELMSKHLPYLFHEVGPELDSSLHEQLGTSFLDFARNAMSGKKPEQSHGPNYKRLNIRGASGRIWRLMVRDKEIGDISDVHLFREAYVGAIYNHFGKPYRVLAHSAGDEVHLEEAESHLRTEPILYTVTQGAEIIRGIRYAENLIACYGRLTVFENFAGYRLIDTRSGEVLEDERREIARPTNVRGFWLALTDLSILDNADNAQALFSVEQFLRIGTPFVVPCDRHDLGTLTTFRPLASIYLYETVPGGIGVAEKALDVWPVIVRTAIKIAENCSCKHSCPSCLAPPHLPTGFEEPRKEIAMAAAYKFLRMAESSMREGFDSDAHAWVPLSS